MFENLFELFSKIYKGKRLLEIDLDNEYHYVLFDNGKGTRMEGHIFTSSTMIEEYDKAINNFKVKKLFKDYPNNKFLPTPTRLIYVPVEGR